MAYTLKQYIDIEKEPLNQYILTNLIRDAQVMGILPYHNINSLTTKALRWKSLPSVAFRNLNSDYTEDTGGDVEEVWESVYVLGGLVKFDRVFDLVSGSAVTDPEKLVMDMKIKALAFMWKDYFINGDLASNPLGFEGLKKRISLMPTRQKIPVDGVGTSEAFDVTASTANVNKFWSQIELSHRYCNDGQVDAILCNENILLGLGRSLRYISAGGGFFLDVTKDAYERMCVTYKGTQVYDMGLLKDQSTEIITLTELDGAANSNDTTSMYFVSFNAENGIVGIQVGPLQTVVDAKKDVATAKQTLIEWINGLAQFGSYGITRLWNIETPASWTA